jgi:nucleoside-diphosphate kinase
VLQQTLVLIKDDIMRREDDAWISIIKIYESFGLKITKRKILHPMTLQQAEELYEEHKDQYFYIPLIDFMTKGITLTFVLEGEDAIQKVRKINGNTNPAQADEGTIRKRFGTNNRENAVHASFDEKASERERSIFFPAM